MTLCPHKQEAVILSKVQLKYIKAKVYLFKWLNIKKKHPCLIPLHLTIYTVPM